MHIIIVNSLYKRFDVRGDCKVHRVSVVDWKAGISGIGNLADQFPIELMCSLFTRISRMLK